VASFCDKCKTGTSSRHHRTKCLKRATLGNVGDEWEAMRKLLAKMTDQIIRLEETVGLLAGSQCRDAKINMALSQLRSGPTKGSDSR
jgi:hypothetical protein